jgi:hypothetical protein
MNKLIATGTVKDDGNVKVVASIYADFDEEGKEVEEVGSHYVVLSYREDDAEVQPMDAMTYADILEKAKEESGSGDNESDEAADEMVVPGAEGHDDVELQAPFAVRYSKTKAFMRNDGTIQVYAALRYVF